MHLPCYAHTLNLTIQENFKVSQAVVRKCKDIVKFFKSSNVAMDMFKKEQNIDTITKFIKNTNCWNYMIEVILKTNDTICRAILNYERRLILFRLTKSLFYRFL